MRDDKRDQERLSEAVRSNNTEAVLGVLKEGVNPDFRDEKGCTQLMVAAAEGYDKSMVALLKRKAKTNLTTPAGFTAVMEAANHGHATCISLLLKAKADPNLCDKNPLSLDIFQTAWSLAIARGYVDCINALIAGGANPNYSSIYRNHLEGFSPLTFAMNIGSDKSVIALLAGHADPNQADAYGRTPLALAIKLDQDVYVLRLLKAKADPNLLAKGLSFFSHDDASRGERPLVYAVRLNRPRLLKPLIQWGARLDLGHFTTPLTEAVNRELTDCISLLLEAGADPEYVFTPAKAPLDREDPFPHDAIYRALLRNHNKCLFLLTGMRDANTSAWLEKNNTRKQKSPLSFSLSNPETRFYVIHWMLACLQAGLKYQRIKDVISLEPQDAPDKDKFLQAAHNIKRLMGKFPLDFNAAYIWHSIREVRLWLLEISRFLIRADEKFSGLPHEVILFWIIRAHQQSNNLFLPQSNNAHIQLSRNMSSFRYRKYLERDYESLLQKLEADFNPDSLFELCREIKDETKKLQAFVSALKIGRGKVSIFIYAFQLLDQYSGLPLAKEILPVDLKEDDGLIRYFRKFPFNLSFNESDQACFRKFYYFSKIHPEIFNECSSVEDMLRATNRLFVTWDEIKNACFLVIRSIKINEFPAGLLGALIALESGNDSDRVKIATLCDVLYVFLAQLNRSSEKYECVNFLYNHCDFFEDENNSVYENEEFQSWVYHYTMQFVASEQTLPKSLDQLIEDQSVLTVKHLSR